MTGGTWTVYIGGIYEKPSNGTYVKYYSAFGRRIAMRDNAGVVHYILADHLGSSTTITDASGGDLRTMKYYPYGAMRSTTGSLPTDKLFTGQQREPEAVSTLGLYNYGARFYSTLTGRFVSPDPVVAEPGDPQMLNRYSYVRNNPLVYVDPTGLYLDPIVPKAPFPYASITAGQDMTQADWAAFHRFLDFMHERGFSDAEIIEGLRTGELVPLLPDSYESGTWSGHFYHYNYWSDEGVTDQPAEISVTVYLRACLRGKCLMVVAYTPETVEQPWPDIGGEICFASGDCSEIEFEGWADTKGSLWKPNTILWVYSFEWEPSWEWGAPERVYLWPNEVPTVDWARFDPGVALILYPQLPRVCYPN